MTVMTKPSAPGSFSKLMITARPKAVAPVKGQTGVSKQKKNKGKQRVQTPTTARVPAPGSAPEEHQHRPPPAKHDTVIPRSHETTTPSAQETTQPRDAVSLAPTIHETIRRAVKQFGKEAATHRFTLAEKKAITDIIYAYKNLGVKTSENEITRIAVNFIINDYKQNGENSILARALKALNG